MFSNLFLDQKLVENVTNKLYGNLHEKTGKLSHERLYKNVKTFEILHLLKTLKFEIALRQKFICYFI